VVKPTKILEPVSVNKNKSNFDFELFTINILKCILDSTGVISSSKFMHQNNIFLATQKIHRIYDIQINCNIAKSHKDF
jgi:hypothetical protein